MNDIYPARWARRTNSPQATPFNNMEKHIPVKPDTSQPQIESGYVQAVSELRICDYLTAYAAKFPDRVAVRDVRRVLTYGQLLDEVNRCAKAMLAEGLKIGDRVAVLAQPRSEAMVTFLAAAKLGLIWLGLNPRYKLPEIEYAVDDARPMLLFGVNSFEDRSYEEEIQTLREKRFIKKFVGFDIKGCYDSDFEMWRSCGELYSESEFERAIENVDSSRSALMVYTSGSSGKPKGVLLCQRALLDRSRTQNAKYSASDYPKVINPFPINHIGGMHYVSLYAFVGAGELIYVDRFRPSEIVAAIEAKEINVLLTIPTMLQLITEAPNFSPEVLDNLEWVAFSGAGMPSKLMRLLFDARCKVGLTYGMTETAGSVTYCIADRVHNNMDEMIHTIGVPVPAGEVRLVRTDGVPCSSGEEGEIQVRALNSMSGYFERNEANAQTFTSDGWMRTGDLGCLRQTGHIEFSGRISEMFKSGGYNVYPKEIELAFEKHPDVNAAAVVPIKDNLYGETGHAFVSLKPGALINPTELTHWLGRRLANYKVPKRITVVDSMPLLSVGKIDKRALKVLAGAE